MRWVTYIGFLLLRKIIQFGIRADGSRRDGLVGVFRAAWARVRKRRFVSQCSRVKIGGVIERGCVKLGSSRIRRSGVRAKRSVLKVRSSLCTEPWIDAILRHGHIILILSRESSLWPMLCGLIVIVIGWIVAGEIWGLPRVIEGSLVLSMDE